MDTIYTDGTYLRNNPDWHVDDSPWKARHIAHILERNRLAPMSVCEVGCGGGEILRSLADELDPRVKFFGYEISPVAYSICSKKANDKFQYRLANVLEEDSYFDLVMAIDVFEHVEDYLGFLRKLRARGRHKLFHIPLELSAFEVARGTLLRQRRSVGHIHHFSKETALASLEDTGYRIIDHHYTCGRTELEHLGWKSQLMKVPRHALHAVNPDWAARWLGGYSLLVLAE
ncbi:MAG TPA: class I SAM-dependent methyltransferase [Usitatibacter sp.]|jgi:cyclopropane fatty-acyl-phospholipid synthase-like methyltransferase|nr:class I SAM-dependent methyltransferase [Usitatibacter sp.]